MAYLVNALSYFNSFIDDKKGEKNKITWRLKEEKEREKEKKNEKKGEKNKREKTYIYGK